MKSDDVAAEASEVRGPSELMGHLRQMLSVFALQMRLYSKNISTYILIILALLVPVLVSVGFIDQLSRIFNIDLNAAYALFLMPLMIVAIPARFSGSILSSEFKSRTAFINFPLPMSRITFYAGKFLAALVMSLAVMLLAIGGAIISSNARFGLSYPNDIASMLIVCIFGMVALLAMTYFIGTLVRRGAGAISIVITIAVPFVLMLALVENSGLWDAVNITPFFSAYQSLWFIDNGFMNGGFDSFFNQSYSVYQLAAVSIAWSIAFFALGAWMTKNKEV